MSKQSTYSDKFEEEAPAPNLKPKLIDRRASLDSVRSDRQLQSRHLYRQSAEQRKLSTINTLLTKVRTKRREKDYSPQEVVDKALNSPQPGRISPRYQRYE